MVSRRGRSGRSSRKLWLGAAILDPTTVAGSTQVITTIVDSSLANDAVSHGATCIRILGQYWAAHGAANVQTSITLGVITLNHDAAMGLAVPDPQLDAADWMWEMLVVPDVWQTGTVQPYTPIAIDIRVARRFREFQRDLLFIEQNESAVSYVRAFSLKALFHVP